MQKNPELVRVFGALIYAAYFSVVLYFDLVEKLAHQSKGINQLYVNRYTLFCCFGSNYKNPDRIGVGGVCQNRFLVTLIF
ncbi:hypothetical protein NUACC21_01450 [Scytonema sp. NUACC21]